MITAAEEQGLLAEVLADPFADSPRLLLADWYEDHGRPDRAESIRKGLAEVAVEQVRAGPLASHRGFYDTLYCTLEEFLREHARAEDGGAFRLHPITQVVLMDRASFSTSGLPRHRWILDTRGLWYANAFLLPPKLFYHLISDDMEGPPYPVQEYDSLDLASKALSRACVALGRERAGLPPLAFPVPLP